MTNVVNVNAFAFSRRNRSSLLIVLLVFLYSNVIPVTTHNSALIVHERKLQRLLSKADANEVSPFKSTLHGDTNEDKNVLESVGKLPKVCNVEDVNVYVNEETELNKVHGSGIVRLSLKDAFIGSYNYFKQLKKGYYKMMESSRKWFYKSVVQCRIPDDVMEHLWEEYETGLIEDLNEMEEFCVESIFDFAGNGRIGKITKDEYDQFNKNMKDICKRFTKLTEKKWKGLMSDKMKIIKKEMNTQKKGKYNYGYDDVVEQFYLDEIMNPIQDETTEEGGEDDDEDLLKKQATVLQQIEELCELCEEEGELMDEEEDEFKVDFEQIDVEEQIETGRKQREKERNRREKEAKSYRREKRTNVKESNPSVKKSRFNENRSHGRDTKRSSMRRR
ncbi:hypothetical protein AK88_01251 [Plasmodium fragile]|uniref:Plasmodium RESA N-terminal domain-containing protein n=1 Tax=Plasmodium fragile TaxID=5857 RepID=A0A0D9QPZ9_PLAFR|nr:uncharacterized protein AK88_01251 [Plasmodium fragile]KJP89165.1 hypothetical protein AK88_01251 [Plasmodium fragile]